MEHNAESIKIEEKYFYDVLLRNYVNLKLCDKSVQDLLIMNLLQTYTDTVFALGHSGAVDLMTKIIKDCDL